MHMAAQNSDHCKEVVSLLLKKGATVDTVDYVSVCMIVIMIRVLSSLGLKGILCLLY